jgi:hypothetical protein
MTASFRQYPLSTNTFPFYELGPTSTRVILKTHEIFFLHRPPALVLSFAWTGSYPWGAAASCNWWPRRLEYIMIATWKANSISCLQGTIIHQKLYLSSKLVLAFFFLGRIGPWKRYRTFLFPPRRVFTIFTQSLAHYIWLHVMILFPLTSLVLIDFGRFNFALWRILLNLHAEDKKPCLHFRGDDENKRLTFRAVGIVFLKKQSIEFRCLQHGEPEICIHIQKSSALMPATRYQESLIRAVLTTIEPLDRLLETGIALI